MLDLEREVNRAMRVIEIIERLPMEQQVRIFQECIPAMADKQPPLTIVHAHMVQCARKVADAEYDSKIKYDDDQLYDVCLNAGQQLTRGASGRGPQRLN